MLSRETGPEEPRCLREEKRSGYSGFYLEAFVTFLSNADERLESQAERRLTSEKEFGPVSGGRRDKNRSSESAKEKL